MGLRVRAAMAGLLGCMLLAGCGLYRPDQKGLEQQVAGAVPLHSSPAQVMAYLNAQKIDHSPYKRDVSIGNTIEAEMQVKTTRALVNPSYNVVFRFDDQNSLTGYDVQYLGYIGW
jgi:hypothetical protein